VKHGGEQQVRAGGVWGLGDDLGSHERRFVPKSPPALVGVAAQTSGRLGIPGRRLLRTLNPATATFGHPTASHLLFHRNRQCEWNKVLDGGIQARTGKYAICQKPCGVEPKSMVCKVVFQRAGGEIETLYWAGSLEETISLARNVAFECGFEEFSIFESGDAEVFSEQLPSTKHG
jgi:hypothetical protein